MVSKIETNPRDVDQQALFDLLQGAFAYMADRISPPSSLTTMTLQDVSSKTAQEDLYLIRNGPTPIACLFGTPRENVYYVGKLAVSEGWRGNGFARSLIEAAALRAMDLGHSTLELQSRVELVENHAAFAAMGFLRTGETTHPGYTRPTSYTFQRRLPSP